MAVRPVPSLSEEIASGIARVRRRLIAEADRRLSERGETVLAFQVLSALQRRGRAAQNELAEHIGQHPTGVSRLLEELEQAGLVRRARDRQRGVQRPDGSIFEDHQRESCLADREEEPCSTT